MVAEALRAGAGREGEGRVARHQKDSSVGRNLLQKMSSCETGSASASNDHVCNCSHGTLLSIRCARKFFQKQRAGSRQQAAGSRQQAAGSRQQAAARRHFTPIPFHTCSHNDDVVLCAPRVWLLQNVDFYNGNKTKMYGSPKYFIFQRISGWPKDAIGARCSRQPAHL